MYPVLSCPSRKDVRDLNNQQADDVSAGSVGGHLYPPVFNVAPRAAITVNATCGQNGAEEYCKLVDAYPHRKWAKQCGICNAHSSDRAKQRPIESLISPGSSFDESWWQSPTLQGGHEYEYVTITLDLKQFHPRSICALGSSLIIRLCMKYDRSDLDRVFVSSNRSLGITF
ncbi:hypothetical protein ACLKA6_007498 [Drosophila palustris]